MKVDLGGTVRDRDASSTLAWVQPFLRDFGITRLANVTGLDCIGIPVWMCIRPNGRTLSVSQGKGVTADLAKASAIMESVELYHAERIAPPDLVASYRTVYRRHSAIDPRRLEPGTRGRAYSPTREIAWITGTDVGSGEPVLVPHARLNMNWSEVHPDTGLFMATSSGLASGNLRSEALCHAIFEAIERHADWRWERLSDGACHSRELDPDTIDSPMLRQLLDQCARAGVMVRMWDFTSEVAVPSYACEISGGGPPGSLGPYGGTGCHLSKEIALARAITEAVQSRLTVISGSRDDMFFSEYAPKADQAPKDSLATPTLSFRERRSPRLGATFDDDLRTTLRLLADAGFPRVVAVDHTRPEFGIPVVAVVVPGLHEAA